MSYTVPTYVDTKEQAILALASAVKGEQVAGGDGSVNRALDILADVLAGEDVQVPQTDAGAILALASLYKPTVLIEKTITANDTYDASDDDADGYSSVTVNVSGGGEDVDLYVWYTPAGTFTLGEQTLTLTPFSEGEFSGGKVSVPNGSFVTYTPSGTMTDNSITWWADAQDLYDDGESIATSTIMVQGIVPIPVVGITSFSPVEE